MTHHPQNKLIKAKKTRKNDTHKQRIRKETTNNNITRTQQHETKTK